MKLMTCLQFHFAPYDLFPDELSDHKMEVHKAEEGFRGTLLTSSVSSQVSEACLN